MKNVESSRRAMGGKLGVIGSVALASGLLTGFTITGFSDPWCLFQFGLAAVTLGSFFATNFRTLGDKFTGRGTFFLTSTAIAATILLAALVGINYIAAKKDKTWDLTKDQLYTLSDQTQSALKALQGEVRVTAFYSPAEPDFREVESKLHRYQAISDKLHVELVDPVRHLAEVRKFNLTTGGPRIIFQAANGKEARAKDASEEALTNALIEVTGGGSQKTIYFVKGHGEHPLNEAGPQGLSQLAEALKSEGYKTAEFVAATSKAVPADAQELVVAGPMGSLGDDELKLIRDWVDTKGGKLVLMVDPTIHSGFESMLPGFGIQLDNDEVLDPEQQHPEWAVAQAYAQHPITTPKTSAFAQITAFPLARSVRKQSQTNGWDVVELAKTGEHAWGEVDPITNGVARYDAGRDVAGPVSLAVAATKGTGASQSRVVVIGNSQFVINAVIKQYGNRDFGLNSIAWAANDESKISIRPKSRKSNTLMLSAAQSHTVSLFAFDLLPFSLLLAGLLVWQGRKSR